MEILHKAAEEQWWVGNTIKCGCGFEAILEEFEDVGSPPFGITKYFLEYSCTCGRTIELYEKEL